MKLHSFTVHQLDFIQCNHQYRLQGRENTTTKCSPWLTRKEQNTKLSGRQYNWSNLAPNFCCQNVYTPLDNSTDYQILVKTKILDMLVVDSRGDWIKVPVKFAPYNDLQSMPTTWVHNILQTQPDVSLTHSVRLTRQWLVGCKRTVLRYGTPWKPRSLYGVSKSTMCLVRDSTLSQKPLNADFSFCRISLSA